MCEARGTLCKSLCLSEKNLCIRDADLDFLAVTRMPEHGLSVKWQGIRGMEQGRVRGIVDNEQ